MKKFSALYEQYMKEIEIAYRIPGKGSFKRKKFTTQAAMEKFINALQEKEGDDIEIEYSGSIESEK